VRACVAQTKGEVLRAKLVGRCGVREVMFTRHGQRVWGRNSRGQASCWRPRCVNAARWRSELFFFTAEVAVKWHDQRMNGERSGYNAMCGHAAKQTNASASPAPRNVRVWGKMPRSKLKRASSSPQRASTTGERRCLQQCVLFYVCDAAAPVTAGRKRAARCGSAIRVR